MVDTPLEARTTKPEFAGAAAGAPNTPAPEAPAAETPATTDPALTRPGGLSAEQREAAAETPTPGSPRARNPKPGQVAMIDPAAASQGRRAGSDGKHRGPDGEVLTDLPQISFGEAMAKFFQMFMMLLKGDFSSFDTAMNGPGGFKEQYVDPVEQDFREPGSNPRVASLTPQQRQHVRDMGRNLTDMRITFDPNMPRIQRLMKALENQGVQQLLTVIKKYESANGNYNIANGGKEPRINGKLLSECTIAEILAEQKRGAKIWGGQSTAAGAYQFIPSTLAGTVKDLGLDPSTTVFNKQTQDLLAVALLEGKGLFGFMKDPSKNRDDFIKGVAETWSSMPLNSSGKAAHGGIANNPYSVPTGRFAEVSSALDNMFKPR